MDFNNIVSFGEVMFFIVLPALLGLLVFIWARDWITSMYKKWKRRSDKLLDEMREDRAMAILELMKVALFIFMIYPIMNVISYFIDDSATDPGFNLFNTDMFYVFIAITGWYLLACVIQSIYLRSRKDMEEDEANRGAKPI